MIPIRIARPIPVLAVLLLAATAAAQPRPAGETGQVLQGRPLLTASEEHLWLVRVTEGVSLAMHREATGTFEASDPLNAPVIRAAAGRGLLYAFVAEGTAYSLAGREWTPELNLPGRSQPLHLLGTPTYLYALVASPAPGELALLAPATPAAETQPYDPGGHSLTVARYDNQGWGAVAPSPVPRLADAAGRMQPRLGLVHGALQIFWLGTDRARIHANRFVPESGQWSDAPAAPTVENVQGFWFATVNRVPTLLIAAGRDDGSEYVRAFRLFNAAEGTLTEWRSASLAFSDLPEGVRTVEYLAAAGFNQHAALLFRDQSDRHYVQFAQFDTPPAETTIAVKTLFEEQAAAEAQPGWLQMLTLLVLLVVMASLFIFRRGAMVQEIEWPAGTAAAFSFQRILGLLVDLLPFTLVASLFTPIEWGAGLQQMGLWALGSDAVTGNIPPAELLLWWGYSTVAYTVYGLVMELLTHRTAGKVVSGTRVLADDGQPPRFWQLLVRNLFRLIELQPPLWILGFLVVLSRNRQRLGDIFAKTVVVRQYQPLPPQDDDRSA